MAFPGLSCNCSNVPTFRVDGVAGESLLKGKAQDRGVFLTRAWCGMQARDDAQAVVNRMINTKAASGQDYDHSSLVSLRQVGGFNHSP